MVAFVALVVGYFIGAKSGSKDLDQVVESLKALRRTEEFSDVVSAVRSHVGHTLRELAVMVDGEAEPAAETGDLVDRVRHLFAREQPR